MKTVYRLFTDCNNKKLVGEGHKTTCEEMVIAVVDDEINRQNSSSFRRSSVLQIRHCMLWICCCLCLCSGYLSICDAFTFHDMTYEDLTHASYELHGDYTTIKTAEELYGIPKAKQVRLLFHKLIF